MTTITKEALAHRVLSPTRTQQEEDAANKTDKLKLTASGSDPNVLIATIDGCEEVLGNMRLLTHEAPNNPKIMQSQRALFRAACAAFEMAKNPPPLKPTEHDPVNAQYIEALREKVWLEDDGDYILIEQSKEGHNQLVHHREGKGIFVTPISKGVTTEKALQQYLTDNYLKESETKPRENSSQSFGVVLKTEFCETHLGQTQEMASIQSVSKVFADITLNLCEENLYEGPDGEVLAIFNLGNQPPNTSGHKKIEPPKHKVPVGSEHSPHPFNGKGNLRNERNDIDETTNYEILNASNNLGALATTGRIPRVAIINGERVEGQSNIIKTLMEELLGHSIGINEPVLKSELADTEKGYAQFLETRKLYEKEKEKLDSKASNGHWSWSARKASLETIKPHIPDNLSRILLLMRKGVFGEEYRTLALAFKADPTNNLEALMAAKEILKQYTTHCAFNVNCEDLATLTAVIASGGLDAKGQPRLSEATTAKAREQMKKGGLYQASNDKDAIKSGVGGFVACAVPTNQLPDLCANQNNRFLDNIGDWCRSVFGEYGLAVTTLNRRLDPDGNSEKGLAFLRHFLQSLREAMA